MPTIIWKYEVGDLLSSLEKRSEETWGLLVVTKRVVLENSEYYECFSQKLTQQIKIAKKALEQHWYNFLA